jgi:hypothetical protein
MDDIKRRILFKFLDEVFLDDNSLQQFCFIDFPEVYSNSSGGHDKKQKIMALMSHCMQHDKINELLNKISMEYVEKYNQHIDKLNALISPQSNEDQIDLYKHYLAYPSKIRNELPAHFKKNKDIVNTFFVFGKSSPLMPITKKSFKKKHIWFVEHLLPNFLSLARTSHTFINFLDTKTQSSKLQLLQEIALYLGVTEEEFDESKIEIIIRDISEVIKAKLADGYIIIPCFVRNNNELIYKELMTFFEDYFNPIMENIIGAELKNALLFLLLFEDETMVDTTIFQIKSLVKNIEIEGTEQDCYDRWFSEPNGFFFQKDICCDISLADCPTQELLFESITKHIFPKITFTDFLKNSHQSIANKK